MRCIPLLFAMVLPRVPLAAQTVPTLLADRQSSVIPAPRDHAFRGVIQLHVDATDVAHGIFSVVEIIPVQTAGDMVLLYPEWQTTSHAPTASVAELAGLQVQADEQNLQWKRDLTNVHAFHVSVPQNARTITVAFEYLSPRAAAELRAEMVQIHWDRLLLYPAGWYARDMEVNAQLNILPELRPFSSLAVRHSSGNAKGLLSFETEPLDRLIDSPVYAARYWQKFTLSAPSDPLVSLDVVADSPQDLPLETKEVAALRRLVLQTQKVFGAAPFRHYDSLVSLSDELSPGGGGGLEHLDEGENNLSANYLTDPAVQLNNRDLIAHEYVHTWNGRFRQPAGMWSPNFNQPIDPSLLWVYEGQTEFWGRVLAARAGLRTLQETLDKLALDSASVANRPGREWKTLEDSTLDVLYMPGHSIAWRDWQRREDYYPEGVLLWLDVDARLRELTSERFGLDDFAHAFFATHGSVETTSTYSFDDICSALHAIAPSDWKLFLNTHLRTHNTDEVMAGLARAGWRLTFTSTPTETFLQDETEAGVVNLDSSVGMRIRQNGSVQSVAWNGPGFRAGLSPGVVVKTVNGKPFSRDAILNALSTDGATDLRLSLQDRDVTRELSISHDSPQVYPHLARIPGTPDRLTPLLMAR